MENKMILKVYDVDYSFIIKNYLKPELWEREWTLFIYKNFVVTLRLKYIYIYCNKICFEVTTTDNNSSSWNRTKSKEIDYSLITDNINILKKRINKAMLRTFETVEEDLYIEKTDEYYKLQEMQEEEREKLRRIAEEFLDSNGIENDSIREAYIEAYVDNTEKVWYLKQDYKRENAYKMLPDLYLTFARAIDDKELEEKILNINFDKQEELLKQIKELEEYIQTEEYENEVKSNLDEV